METPENVEQAPEASTEDRVAGIFAPEQAEVSQEAATQQETAPETFDLEYEGERFQLPKKLEKAVMQEKDYTQKSQTLAERQRDVDRQFAQIKLAQAESAFQQYIKADTDQIGMIDAVLAEYDKLRLNEMTLEQAFQKKLEIEGYEKLRKKLDEGVKAKKAEYEKLRDAELNRIKSESTDTLRKRFNWSDDTEKEVREYARSEGFTDAEIDGAYDPRAKAVFWKAAQYDKLKAGAQPAAQQARTVKASSNAPMSQSVKDQLAFHRQLSKAGNDPTAKKRAVESEVERIFSMR